MDHVTAASSVICPAAGVLDVGGQASLETILPPFSS